MKILYFSPHPNLNFGAPSGPGTHMREMVRAFGELGHEVERCILGGEEWQHSGSSPGGGGLKQKLKPWIPSILWHTMKDRRLRAFDKHAADELHSKCASFQPDLIYERGYYLMTSGVEVAEELGIPHILEINAPYPEEKVDMEGRSLLHAEALKAELLQAEKSNQLVVVSTALKEYYEKRYPGISAKTVVTPNAVRDPDAIPSESEGRNIRLHYGIGPDALVFGFVGSIFPYHGVDALISGFESLGDPTAHLLIVGGGEILDDLKAQANASDLGQRITFTGNIPPGEVAAHIAAMDITVMAQSNWYGSPVKIFEYGLQGKPVIAPNVGPVRDVMRHEENALLVGEESTSISEAMKRLLEDETLRKQLGQAFQSQIRRQHTWKKMAEEVLKAYPFSG